MSAPRHRAGWVPLLTGLAWLFFGLRDGGLAALLSLAPGIYLLGAGWGMLRWPAERRPSESAALGSILSGVAALPALWLLGLGPAVLLGLLSAASFFACGWVGLRMQLPLDGVPRGRASAQLIRRVGVDQAMLGFMQHTIAVPGADEARAIGREVEAALELFDACDWTRPSRYLNRPPPLDKVTLSALEVGSRRWEQLHFASEYEPEADEPGRERWLGYEANRDAYAWVVRHRGEPRPWLVCLHGYRMGEAAFDLRLFDPAFLHEQLGLNVIVPVFPLHGPRRYAGRSGTGYLDGRVLDTVHGVAQAMWDLRRLLSWLRGQGAPQIGVYGVSLGSYHAALLSAIEPGLAGVLAGLALADLPRVMWRHGGAGELAVLERAGITRPRVTELMRAISPLHEPPPLAPEQRAIYASTSDRIVPPDQARDLWEHWEHPRIEWVPAGHLTFWREPAILDLQREFWPTAGLTSV